MTDPKQPPASNSTSDKTRLVYPGLTPARLSMLACLLGGGTKDEPAALVQRAAAIWSKANEVLNPTAYQQWMDSAYLERGWISFAELAEQKRVVTSGYSGTITSVNGIKKTVQAFYEALENNLTTGLGNQMLDKTQLKALKSTIVQQRDNSLGEGRLPYRIVEVLQRFQRSRRDKQPFPASPSDFADALGLEPGQLGRRIDW